MMDQISGLIKRDKLLRLCVQQEKRWNAVTVVGNESCSCKCFMTLMLYSTSMHIHGDLITIGDDL